MARMRNTTNEYRILIRKPECRRATKTPACRWEYNIKTELKKTGWQCVVWIDMTQDTDRWRAVVSTVMNLWVL